MARSPLFRPLRTPRHAPRTAACAALAAGLLAASCATGPERRPTFVGRAEGARQELDVAVGLNPLASLDTCPPGELAPPRGARVLISPPSFFSKQATEMILQLRHSLVQSPHAGQVQMWLAPEPLRDAEAAQAEGERCRAVIVLWEAFGTNTLELTLPAPAKVPLRHLVRERLCEFGSDRQQVAILFFTVSGLAAMLDNRYDEAVYYMDAANRIDLSCLQLPIPPPSTPETAGGAAPPPAVESP
jgi:hypothetical protein